MQMQCTCGKILEISQPIAEIVNQMTFTALIFNHAAITGNSCVCGAIYLPVLQGFAPEGLKFGMRKVDPPQEQSRIIGLDGKGYQA